jgi:hypothetical protein
MSNTLEDSFVPLAPTVASPGSRAEFRSDAIPGIDRSPAAFQALGQAVKLPAPAPTPAKNCEPRIALQNQNGQVSGIRIECSCGQIFELECIYQAPPVPVPPPVTAPAPAAAVPATLPAPGPGNNPDGHAASAARREPASGSRPAAKAKKASGKTAAKKR